MFPLQITIANVAQLNAVMAALNIETEKDAAAPVEKSKKTTSAKTEVVASTVPTAKAEAATVPEKTESASDQPVKSVEVAAPVSTVAISYQDAATAITKLSRMKGRDTAVALLAKFGAANLKEVKPEQFADLLAAVSEALGGQ